jgi:hypothetical protein
VSCLGEVVDLAGEEDREGAQIENRKPATLAGKIASGTKKADQGAATAVYPKKRSLGVSKKAFVPWSERKNK